MASMRRRSSTVSSPIRARSYMFSEHDPGKMFSKQVLGTRAFRFKIGTHLGLRSMTYCVYTAQHVLGFTSFRLRFGGVLRGRFVPRTRFDRVPAGTVLAGT